MKNIKFSLWVAFVFLFSLLISGCSASTSGEKQAGKSSGTDSKAVNIGYQKFGTLNILKAKKSLEKELKPLGYSVKWTEFPAGPQLLEALNVGSLDFGHTGEAPPIFAQAAGAPLVYFANAPANPKGEAILVPKDSKIKTIKDLKGKKIALNKGSNVHYLLVKALEKAGLKYEDVQTSFLPPADGRAAFEKGEVDAWIVWDPFLADAELATEARILTDGTGLVNNREFFLATSTFAKEHPEVLDVIFKEIQKTEKWVQENPKKAAEYLAPQIGMDVKTLELTLGRRTFGLTKMTDAVAKDQQQIADQFFQLKLIPKKINVNNALVKAPKN